MNTDRTVATIASWPSLEREGDWPGTHGYVVPEPPNGEVYPMDVGTAGWPEAMGELVLPVPGGP